LRSKSKLALHIGLATLVISFVFTLIPWRDRVQPPGSGEWVTGEILEPLGSDASSFLIAPGQEVPATWTATWAQDLRESGTTSISFAPSEVLAERGLISVLRSLRAKTILAVLVAAIGGLLCGIFRWWRLLQLCGVRTGFLTAARLTLLGLFFNLALPGLTGGDIIKAGVAAKENPGRRPAAILAVGLDRALGLWVLLWIGAISSLTFGGELYVVAAPLGALALTSTLALVIVFIPALRNRLGARFLARLAPKGLSGAIDAFRAATSRPTELLAAILLSLGNHLCVGFGVYAVARGVGDSMSFTGCLTASAVANSLSAIPLAPGGWGVGEAAYAAMFSLLGSTEAVGYAVSLGTRLCMTVISFLSGFVIWRGGGMADWKTPAPDEGQA
jgi:uncharacterized protein (TIRG00374 family)